jgi:hypothetical protein
VRAEPKKLAAAAIPESASKPSRSSAVILSMRSSSLSVDRTADSWAPMISSSRLSGSRGIGGRG